MSRHIFTKVSNTKFYLVPSSGSRADACNRRTDGRKVWGPDVISVEDSALSWRFNLDGDIKTYLGLHVKCNVFCPRFKKKIAFSRHIFMKFPSIKIQGNLSRGRKADIYGQPDGQRDWRGEAKSRFLRQCESAQKMIEVTWSGACVLGQPLLWRSNYERWIERACKELVDASFEARYYDDLECLKKRH